MIFDNKEFHIYMAEDDLDDQDIFYDAIANIDENIKIKMFTDGILLLEALSKNKDAPHVIFLDLHMPKMDGEETLKEIRKQSALNNIPVVIFSNEYNIDRIANLFEMGANRYLHKPESFKTLVSALDRTICSIKSNDLGGTAIINYKE